MGVRSAVVKVVRLCLRYSLSVFLSTLPITIFAIIAGVYEGFKFVPWSNQRMFDNVGSLELEMQLTGSHNYHSVPGAPSMHEWLDDRPPFHIPRITSFDWLGKLGFTQPDQYAAVWDFNNGGDIPLDKMGALDGLVRCPTCAHKPTNFWVYVTRWPDLRAFDPEWADAFQTIIEKLCVTPQPDDTGIYFLDCAGSGFLCGVWEVRSPSLIHFSVSNSTLTQHKIDDAAQYAYSGFTYQHADDHLRPVTTRIIEFPLSEEEGNGLLPRNWLPTPLIQLESLMLDPEPENILTRFDPHDSGRQILLRYSEYLVQLAERKWTTYWCITQVDEWYTDNILKPILGLEYNGGTLATIQTLVFLATTMVAKIIDIPIRWAEELYAWYFGLNWKGEPETTYVLEEEEVEAEPRNMFDDMMEAFFKNISERIASEKSEAAAMSVTTELPTGP